MCGIYVGTHWFWLIIKIFNYVNIICYKCSRIGSTTYYTNFLVNFFVYCNCFLTVNFNYSITNLCVYIHFFFFCKFVLNWFWIKPSSHITIKKIIYIPTYILYIIGIYPFSCIFLYSRSHSWSLYIHVYKLSYRYISRISFAFYFIFLFSFDYTDFALYSVK